MTRTWISHMYMAGVLIAFLYIFGKRLRLQRTVLRMKMQFVNGKTVYITDMNITPFAAGLFRPKIVLPKVMADNYTKDEMEAIIRHEQTHIHLCHLWYYFIWDILRCLIWFNPYFSYDDNYVYVDRAAFELLLSENNMSREVFIVFGGYHKFPGIATAGNSCFYQVDSNEENVRTPYKKVKESWLTKLFKIL